MYVHQFNHLRRFIQQFQTAILERELLAACRPLVSLSVRSGVRSALPSALDAAEGLFLATVFSTVFWALLIFTIARRH
jgi:hypothetical protein